MLDLKALRDLNDSALPNFIKADFGPISIDNGNEIDFLREHSIFGYSEEVYGLDDCIEKEKIINNIINNGMENYFAFIFYDDRFWIIIKAKLDRYNIRQGKNIFIIG